MEDLAEVNPSGDCGKADDKGSGHYSGMLNGEARRVNDRCCLTLSQAVSCWLAVDPTKRNMESNGVHPSPTALIPPSERVCAMEEIQKARRTHVDILFVSGVNWGSNM